MTHGRTTILLIEMADDKVPSPTEDKAAPKGIGEMVQPIHKWPKGCMTPQDLQILQMHPTTKNVEGSKARNS